MASKPKRNYLTLEKKVDIIKTAEKNRGMSICELREQFDCGKTQIAKILKSKESILSLYESNAPGSRVLASKHVVDNLSMLTSANPYMIGIPLLVLITWVPS